MKTFAKSRTKMKHGHD